MLWFDVLMTAGPRVLCLHLWSRYRRWRSGGVPMHFEVDFGDDAIEFSEEDAPQCLLNRCLLQVAEGSIASPAALTPAFLLDANREYLSGEDMDEPLTAIHGYLKANAHMCRGDRCLVNTHIGGCGGLRVVVCEFTGAGGPITLARLSPAQWRVESVRRRLTGWRPVLAKYDV